MGMYDNYLSRILIGVFFPPILGCFFFYLLFYAIGSKHGLLESAQVFVVFSIWSLFIFGIPSLIYSLVMEYFVQKVQEDKIVYATSSFLGGLVGVIMSYGGFIIGILVGFIMGVILRYHYKTANKKINKDT
jgi:hypothetical protein